MAGRMALGVDGSVVSEAYAVSQDADPVEVQRAEQRRTRLDCTGTVWATYAHSDGRGTCHGQTFPQGAPDISDCTVRVEYETPSGWVTHKGRLIPEEISEERLLAFGGGRRYRCSLRHAGMTIKGSSLLFDLTSRGDAHPIDDGTASAEATAPAPAAAVPAPAEASTLVTLGQSPVAALLGSVIASTSDPTAKLCFALLIERADAAEKRRKEEQDAAEKRRTEDLARASATTKLMVEHLSNAFQAGAVARPEVDALRAQLHAKEIAEARAAAASSNAPPPLDPVKAHAIEVGGRVFSAVLAHGVEKLVEKVPAEAATALVTGAAQAAQAAA